MTDETYAAYLAAFAASKNSEPVAGFHRLQQGHPTLPNAAAVALGAFEGKYNDSPRTFASFAQAMTEMLKK